jgi:hypothetical protein
MGTFRKGQLVSTFTNPGGIVISDWNLDGASDLAVWDETSISILLGKGDGTFNAAKSYLPATDTCGGNSPGIVLIRKIGRP